MTTRGGLPTTTVARTLVDVVRAAGLRHPQVNQHVNGQVDFQWPDLRLIVEVDGKATHETDRGRSNDHRRDARHLVNGWRTLRFTYADVFHDPAYVLAALRAVMAL